ncbi:MAG: hypothetical protein [Circular genetic element sp.]|nr:MAG: hypothetical protein [Circular genetic element sp.]
MNILHRYYDPLSHCPGCSKIHRALVIAMGHYCPPLNRTILTTGETSQSIQSHLAFCDKGVSDRKTFKERYEHWKTFLANQ